MTDIVTRLRHGVYGTDRIPLCAEAADEIERLRLQLESQKNEWLSWDGKRAALELDAARYRWLRAGKYSFVVARSILNDTPDGIDAFIDAAMKA